MPQPAHQQINERLIALWALGEAGGGLLVVLRFPMTGMVVTAFAVLSLSLLCYYNDCATKPMLKAWLVVILTKFAFNPLASPLAYTAITFEALLAVFSFRFFKDRNVACLVTGVGALLQTVLMQLFLVHKKVADYDFWQGPFQFKFTQIFDRMLLNAVQQSTPLTILYILVFIVAGLLVGLLAAELPALIRREAQSLHLLAPLEIVPEKPSKRNKKRRKIRRRNNYTVPIILFALSAFLLLNGNPKGWSLLRFALMWLLVFTDFVQRYLIHWIQALVNFLFSDQQIDLHPTRDAIPRLSDSMKLAWYNSGRQGGHIVARISLFVAILFALGLSDPIENTPPDTTGAVQEE